MAKGYILDEAGYQKLKRKLNEKEVNTSGRGTGEPISSYIVKLQETLDAMQSSTDTPAVYTPGVAQADVWKINVDDELEDTDYDISVYNLTRTPIYHDDFIRVIREPYGGKYFVDSFTGVITGELEQDDGWWIGDYPIKPDAKPWLKEGLTVSAVWTATGYYETLPVYTLHGVLAAAITATGSANVSVVKASSTGSGFTSTGAQVGARNYLGWALPSGTKVSLQLDASQTVYTINGAACSS